MKYELWRKQLAKFLVLVLLCTSIGGLFGVRQISAAWFNTNWSHRVQLTVDPTKIPSAQTDFVAYVDLSLFPASFFSTVTSNGADIVVTGSDEVTQLDHELVSLNTTLQTGELHVKIPSVSDTLGTDIYVYYGNASAANSETVNTWSDYRAVWHLDEPASTIGAGGFGVASQGAMDGTDGGWAVLYGANAISGSAINVAVDEDEIGDTERAHTTEQVFFWHFNSTSDLDILDSTSSIIGEAGMISSVGSTSSLHTFRNSYTNPVIVTINNLLVGTDSPSVVRIDSLNSTQVEVYLQTPGGIGSVTAQDVYYIVVEAGSHTLPGGIPLEAGTVNVTGVNRSSDWGSTQMVNLSPANSYTTPVVLGQVMTDNEPKWQNFWSSNGNRQNPPNASNIYLGRMIGADTDATRAAEDIGYIILESGSGTTGGSTFNAGLSADFVEGVDNSPPYIISVGGGGLSGSFNDSTINAFTTNYTGSITGENTGQLGNAVFAPGTTDSRLPIGGLTYSNTNNLTELTASLWLKTTDTARSGILDFDRSEHWQIGMNFHNAGGDAGKISFDTANSADGIQDLNSATTINDDNWNLVTVVYDAADINDKKIYINGVLSSQADQHSTGLGRGTTRYGFMADGSEASSFNGGNNNLLYEGFLDEVRIQHSAKSADTILAEYNNQSDNATFWSAITAQALDNPPQAPTNLFFNHTSAQTGLTNPTDVTVYGTSSRIPYFSAVFNDSDILGDTANQARIQVSTDPTFSSITHWDSGFAAITDVTNGNRSADIEYGNFGNASTLPLAMDDGNVSYYWRIAFTDDGGNVGDFSAAAVFSLLDIPNDPSGLSATKVSGTPDTFTLSWLDTSTNEDNFELERRDNTGGGFGAYATITGSPFTENTTSVNDTNTVNNAEYQYRIRSCNYAGCSAYTEDPFTHFTEPTPPDGVFADYVLDAEFTINYIDRSILNGVTIDRCVSQTACAANTFTNLVTQKASVQDNADTETDNSVAIVTNEAFRWRVEADNGITTSEYTYTAFEYTTPAAPSAITAVYQTDTMLLVSWTDNSAYEDGFRISVSENGGAFTEITPGVNTVGANITSYLYTSANANSSYQFRVHAHIGATTQNAALLSSTADSGTVKSTPAQPTITSIVYVADNDITINWSDNATNEDQYEVLVSENGGGFVSQGALAIDSTSFNYTTASANTRYEFQVRAQVNASAPENPVALSAISTTSTPFTYTTPLAPALASGTLGPSSIDWSVTDNAAFDFGTIFYQSDGETEVQQLAVANVTNWTEVGLSPNTQYSRVVRAYVENDSVPYTSPVSNTITVYTLANAPDTITLSSTNGVDATLNWGENGNPAGTEFFAENLTLATNSGWSTATSWFIPGLECDVDYEFKLRSRNTDLVETLAEEITLSFPCSGGGATFRVLATPTNLSLSINNGEACTTSPLLELVYAGDNTNQVMMTHESVFFGTVFQSFTPGESVFYELPTESGLYTIRSQFKSQSGIISVIIEESIELDLETNCGEEIEELEEEMEIPEEDTDEEELPKEQNQSNDFFIAIRNPNQTVREMNSSFAQIQIRNDSTTRIFFEDSGVDNDFNDVQVEVKEFKNELYGQLLSIEVIEVNGAWHHEVLLIYEGVEYIAFVDSHFAQQPIWFDISEKEFVFIEKDEHLVKNPINTEVYLIKDGVRRVFVNELAFFSRGYTFAQIEAWSISQLRTYPLAGVIMPKAESVLVKTVNRQAVYYLLNNPSNTYIPVLAEIPSEQYAIDNLGSNWNEYVIDLDPSIFSSFSITTRLTDDQKLNFQPVK